MTIRIVLAALAAGFLVAQAPRSTPVSGYRIVKTYPHDPDAFTQGLLFSNGFLYESTGQLGASSLRKVDLYTGRVLQKVDVDRQYFGEGLTLWKDKLIQLTWQTRIGFVYDRDTMKMIKTFVYRTEGWGLTHDGRRLILSDGSSKLYLLDPESFREVGQIQVRDRGVPVGELNELEYVKGEIWANVWQTYRIARIAPATGAVVGWIDLEGLQRQLSANGRIDVMNGIAWDSQRDRVFVTGKWWPKLFEIQIVPR